MLNKHRLRYTNDVNNLIGMNPISALGGRFAGGGHLSVMHINVIIIIIEVICKHLPCSRGWPPFLRKVGSGMGFGFILGFGPADGALHV